MISLQNTKSSLAKLLATENFNVEHGKYDTAAFDVKNRILYLPNWKNINEDVYDLFVSHEVSHALNTPSDGWHNVNNDKGDGYKSFLNVIEDARIEKLIKRKYPGVRIPMIRGYKHLMDMDIFGIRGMDVDELPFIDRINIHTKSGWNSDIFFSEEENEMLTEVEFCETFEDVLRVTDMIYEYSKHEEVLTDNHVNFSSFGEDEDEDEIKNFEQQTSSQQTQGSGQSSSQKSEQKSEQNSEQKSDNSSSGQDGDIDGEQEKKNKQSGKEGGKGVNENPFSQTDKNFRKNENKFKSDDNKEVIYNYVPDLDSSEYVLSYQDMFHSLDEYFEYYETCNILDKFKEEYEFFTKDNKKVVNYLVKEFEMKKRAELSLRAQTSKKGIIDSKSIYSYKFSEDIFSKITTIPNGKNHGLVMLVDWSGSMARSIYHTIQQTIVLSMFCRKVKIDFEVLLFHDDKIHPTAEKEDYSKKYKIKDKWVEDVDLRTIFSSKMSNKEFNKACYYMFTLAGFYQYYYEGISPAQNDYYLYGELIPNKWKLCGTPLNDSLFVMFDYLEKYKSKTKIEILNLVVLTDGESFISTKYFFPHENEFVSRQYLTTGRYHDNVYLSDRKTKKSYKLSVRQTPEILKLLKDRLGINIINFHLCGKNDVKYILRNNFYDYDLEEEYKGKIRKDGSVSIPIEGYDESFIILRNLMELDDTDYLEKLNESPTKAQLKKAFLKNTNTKLKNRVILQKFIEKIS